MSLGEGGSTRREGRERERLCPPHNEEEKTGTCRREGGREGGRREGGRKRGGKAGREGASKIHYWQNK